MGQSALDRNKNKEIRQENKAGKPSHPLGNGGFARCCLGCESDDVEESGVVVSSPGKSSLGRDQ